MPNLEFDPRLTVILERVLRETDAARITWEERGPSSAFSSMLEYSAINYGMALRAAYETDMITLVIKNSGGDEVGRIVSSDPANEDPWMNPPETDEKLRKLFQSALKSARRVDETLDGILSDLDDVPPF